MKIILKDLNNNTLNIINNFNHDDYFNYSTKVISVEYDENYKLFDKLGQDAIILKPCKNSKDFIIEYISKSHVDRINSYNKYGVEIDYTKIIGRYFTKIFPFLDNSKILKLFNEVVKTRESLEFRELKYIEDVLISSYRHKIFFSNGKIFHLAYFEDDLELLFFTGKEFFDNSERPYILIEGDNVLNANNQFLEYFKISYDDILGKFDYNRLNLIEIDLSELKTILNNLLNRKSLFEIFEFSIVLNDYERYFRAYASPSSHDFKPAVKIFFEEISEEKKYEMESFYLQNTLDLVQKSNDIACFFKDDSIENQSKIEYDYDDEYFEDNIINSNRKDNVVEYFDMEDFFEKRSKSNDIENLLNNSTVYSKGIINILNLDSDFNLNEIRLLDYIVEDDKEEFLSELKSFSKNYNLINTNFRIAIASSNDFKSDVNLKNQFSLDFELVEDYESLSSSNYESLSDLNEESLSSSNYESLSDLNEESLSSSNYESLSDLNEESLSSSNYESLSDLNEESLSSSNYESLSDLNEESPHNFNEKYINFILEGIFDENGELIEYNGFLKDASETIYDENILKDKLSNMDDLLDNISELNQKLNETRKSKEILLNDSHKFIDDLLELFIKIMDYNLDNGMNKKSILENIERRINYLIKIHDYIYYKDFNLLSINVKKYFKDLISHLSGEFNFSYDEDMDELSINIASISYLTIIVYELFYNIFDDKNELYFKLKNNGDDGYFIIQNNYDKDDLEQINKLNLISNAKSKHELLEMVTGDDKLKLIDDNVSFDKKKDKQFFSLNLIRFIINSLDFDLISDENEELFIIHFPINSSQIISFNY